jgi:hypothetical protein
MSNGCSRAGASCKEIDVNNKNYSKKAKIETVNEGNRRKGPCNQM